MSVLWMEFGRVRKKNCGRISSSKEKLANINSGEATGGLGGLNPPPHLPPGQLLGFVQNRREIFLGRG
jgi:hypothetical protein